MYSHECISRQSQEEIEQSPKKACQQLVKLLTGANNQSIVLLHSCSWRAQAQDKTSVIRPADARGVC
jgi:hypothetical protein